MIRDHVTLHPVSHRSRSERYRARGARLLRLAVCAGLAITCWSRPSPPQVDPSAFAVAAYGDSLTSGTVTTAGWPTWLPGSWLRFNGGIDAERGVPARNVDGTEAITGTRRPISPPDFQILADSWDVVVLMWGTNDVTYPGYSDELHQPPQGWQGPVITDEDLMGSIEGAAMTLQAAGVRPVVAWPPPLLEDAEAADLANARLLRMRDPLRSRLVARGVTFVDLFGELSASEDLTDPAIHYLDTVHLNVLGANRVANLITAAIAAGCPEGFSGPSCAVDVDECEPDPCQNGGTCTDGIASFTCTCAPGFSGPTCETSDECPPGFAGATCEIDVDECAGDPCENGGACTDGIASFTCDCPPGFTGATCEIDVDECANDPCENGGACTDGIASFTCDCPPGFTGATCEIDVDECAGDPCENGGACTDGIATFSCDCPPGFTGATCEIDIDECASDPCQNGGTCTDGIASFTCDCPPGFTGATCEIDVDECANDPCEPGEVCVEGDGSFTCVPLEPLP